MSGAVNVTLAVASAALPFGVLVTFVLVISWRHLRRFDGCCPPPDKGRLWVCGHCKPWFRFRGGDWRRISKRRYLQLAMTELTREVEKATRGGRKH